MARPEWWYRPGDRVFHVFVRWAASGRWTHEATVADRDEAYSARGDFAERDDVSAVRVHSAVNDPQIVAGKLAELNG